MLCAGGAAAEEEAAKPGGGAEMCASQWEGSAVPVDAADTDWPCSTERCNKAEGELIHRAFSPKYISLLVSYNSSSTLFNAIL